MGKKLTTYIQLTWNKKSQEVKIFSLQNCVVTCIGYPISPSHSYKQDSWWGAWIFFLQEWGAWLLIGIDQKIHTLLLPSGDISQSKLHEARFNMRSYALYRGVSSSPNPGTSKEWYWWTRLFSSTRLNRPFVYGWTPNVVPSKKVVTIEITIINHYKRQTDLYITLIKLVETWNWFDHFSIIIKPLGKWSKRNTKLK